MSESGLFCMGAFFGGFVCALAVMATVAFTDWLERRPF